CIGFLENIFSLGIIPDDAPRDPEQPPVEARHDLTKGMFVAFARKADKFLLVQLIVIDGSTNTRAQHHILQSTIRCSSSRNVSRFQRKYLLRRNGNVLVA